MNGEFVGYDGIRFFSCILSEDRNNLQLIVLQLFYLDLAPRDFLSLGVVSAPPGVLAVTLRFTFWTTEKMMRTWARTRTTLYTWRCCR